MKKIKKRILRFLINIVTSGKYTGEKAFGMSDHLIRYVLMNFIIIFGFIVLVLFAIVNFKNKVYTDATICIIMSIIGFACFFFARTKTPQIVPAWIMLFFYGLLCVILTWAGEAHGANFLLMFMYPLLTIMMLGIRGGVFLAAFLLCIVSAQMFFPGLSKFDYHIDITIRMITSYILVFTVMIVVEITRKTKDRFIETQNKKLQELKEEAEKANKSKSSFLATMSHEIRTPLNAIIGIAQIEMQNEDLPEKYLSSFEKIQSSGSSLLGIINDILDMSKVESGKLELNPTEYDVPSLINDTVQLNIVRIGSKPIEFRLDIKENLPAKLCGDELRIKQILNNLLSNAIKYTEKGEVSLSVRYIISDEDIMLKFIVKDTGQGMKEEDRVKLFSSEYLRFNANENRATEGTGLGLNITKKLVEMMEGTISVESEHGKGSTFTATIWQKTDEYTPIGEDLAQRLSNFTFTSRKQNSVKITREPMPYGSVLVVDDVDTNLYVAHGMLSPYKLKIELAASGFAAIEKIDSGNIYDIVFMDHMMPQMDGIETTQKLREGGYKGIIVALTANALTGNDEMFAQNGFDGFIPKPIDIIQLNAILNKFIRDKYPEEAKKYKPEISTQPETTEINPKVLQVFCGDAKKAIITLRETSNFDNSTSSTKFFTICAHAMKSALANVGEKEASMAAAALESAGQRGDTDFISANTEALIKTLEELIDKFSPARKTPSADEDNEDSSADASENAAEDSSVDAPEDAAYLKEQLEIVKTACEDYDDDTAFAALDRLKEKPWNSKTADMLEEIRDMLYIYSDFDGVKQRIENLYA